jgi:hypothetical protein
MHARDLRVERLDFDIGDQVKRRGLERSGAKQKRGEMAHKITFGERAKTNSSEAEEKHDSGFLIGAPSKLRYMKFNRLA